VDLDDDDDEGRNKLGKEKFPAEFPREWHEEFALQAIKDARRDLRFGASCSPNGVYAIARANKEIGHARTHLATLSRGGVARRTGRFWGMLNRTERAVEKANNAMASCFLDKRSALAGGSGGARVKVKIGCVSDVGWCCAVRGDDIVCEPERKFPFRRFSLSKSEVKSIKAGRSLHRSVDRSEWRGMARRKAQ